MGGERYGVIIDEFNLEIILGLFWRLENGMWEGVINNCFNDQEIRIIRNDKTVLLLRKEIYDELLPDQSLKLNTVK